MLLRRLCVLSYIYLVVYKKYTKKNAKFMQKIMHRICKEYAKNMRRLYLCKKYARTMHMQRF